MKFFQRFSFKKLINNKRYSLLLSVVIAFGMWLIITINQKPTMTRTFSDVAVNVNLENTYASENSMSIIGDIKPEECVMIGDNLEVDIKVPYEIGMKVYHLNKCGTTKYPTIRKIEELKEKL